MTTPEGEPSFSWLRPWRSAAAGWVVAALVLLAGVPLFLCMPPWNDVTLHDMAVRSILRGGVHYRDVFDTNLPGIDWAMAAVRWLFGWSYEVLRAVDLLVVAGIVAALGGWVRRCDATGYAVAWFAAAVALFYPFSSEFNHVQRDVWMLLPAVLAARLRVRRVKGELKESPPQPPPCREGEKGTGGPDSLADSESTSFSPSLQGGGRGVGQRSFLASTLEGFIWGLAVWMKPHAVVPAFAVWAVSVVLLLRRESRGRVAADFAGLILGGLLAGVPGVLWLVATGAWPYFLDIFLNWNPDYLSNAGPLSLRIHSVFDRFPPWSLLHYAAIPVAIVTLLEARAWSRRLSPPAKLTNARQVFLPARDERTASARALLAAFYLAWLLMVVFLQKPFDYVHLPLTLLAMAVVAGQRWCFVFAYPLWFAAVWILVNVAGVQVDLEPHPLTNWDVVKLWPRCWGEGGSPELRDKLGQFTGAPMGTNWRELNQVADYLRHVDPPLKSGELNCWNDTTHPLYLMLDLDPATRYMHYGTVFAIRPKSGQIAEEVRASRQRYVVSDLRRMTYKSQEVYGSRAWRAGDPLPVWLPPNERRRFPWNQPVVFRAGRYLVHKIDPTRPLGVIRVPEWDKLDRLAEPDGDGRR